MKTKESIKKEIEELQLIIKKQDPIVKSTMNKIDNLKLCMAYIETSPKEEFLEKQVNRIDERIKLIMLNYKPLDAERFPKAEVSKHKKDFEKLMGIPHLKNQLKILKYILN